MFIVRTIIYKWRTFQLATFDYQRLNVQNQNCGPLTIWLVVWNMNFIFPITLGILSSQLTFNPSFFRGVGRYTTNQIFIFIYISYSTHYQIMNLTGFPLGLHMFPPVHQTQRVQLQIPIPIAHCSSLDRTSMLSSVNSRYLVWFDNPRRCHP